MIRNAKWSAVIYLIICWRRAEFARRAQKSAIIMCFICCVREHRRRSRTNCIWANQMTTKYESHFQTQKITFLREILSFSVFIGMYAIFHNTNHGSQSVKWQQIEEPSRTRFAERPDSGRFRWLLRAGSGVEPPRSERFAALGDLCVGGGCLAFGQCVF